MYSDTSVDRVTFLKRGFAGYARVVDSLDIIQRADLYAGGILLFAGEVLFPKIQMVKHTG